MKQSYKGFEAKKRTGFITLPPVGAYIAEIQNVRLIPADGEKYQRDTIELMIEITEGEYKGRYHEVYKNQDERFGNASYKGVFRLIVPKDGDEDWRIRSFESNLWAVQESNSSYTWDWDEKKLKGKKVGINVREYLYTYNGQDRSTTEIGQLESIKEVESGQVRTMKPRNRREKKDVEEDRTDGSEFTEVNNDIDVPWP